ncbi:DUF881 domain-containing protein [Streptomyces albidus (ex Kaewkla and Franco 2022)]|uniref:DUF881 domain-containing protein n=1 Tax=Streptomyces albidus (ex Kaewkla and Franco 2022) TaxID=722709 RepID=UPI0015EEEC8D|nr:DUF881 domain-containing protein [Streptomyces albidus (ex Kaewkla and Franco 2022)]
MSDGDDKKHPGELPPEGSGAENKPKDEDTQPNPPDAPEPSRASERDGAPNTQEPPASSASDGPAASSETREPAGNTQGEQKPLPEPSGESAARTGRQRLVQAVWPPRVTRAQLIVALLLFVLGLGLAIQVRSTSENSSLRGARQEDLVRILDELDDRTKRLEDEKQSLEGQRTELENSSDQAEEARKQTRQKARQLGVLAGTVGAEGPGIELTVTDPGKSVEADMLLDAVQELRAAGAEAIEINNVRVVASTYFSDSSGGVRVDGHKISGPYRFQVIGKPQDLEPALNIPGGVVQTLRKEQAEASVTPAKKIVVDALRSVKRPDYARSSSR